MKANHWESAKLNQPLTMSQQSVLTALLGCQRASWEQGVAGHALLDLGQRHLVQVLARDAVVRQSANGRLGELGDNFVNGAANAEAVSVLAREGDQSAASALRRQLAWLISAAPRASDGTMFHIGSQVWVDTVYMVVPFLVQAGRLDHAVQQLEGHRGRLFDPETGLYAHSWDEQQQRPIRTAHWGTGNEWIVAALARALRHAAGRHHELTGWVDHVRTVVDACLAHRTVSGLFHDIVDDPDSFEEVNLAQMLAYAIGVGVTDGWLPEGYRDIGGDLLATASDHIDPDGFLFPACGSPHFDRPGIAPEAQAFYLLASAALAPSTAGDPTSA